MALDILEWGVIAVMGIAIFLFGPEKGAEIAKKLGAARRDLDAATKQLQGMSKELGAGVGTGGLDGLLGGIIPGISGNPTAEVVAAGAGGGAAAAAVAARTSGGIAPAQNTVASTVANAPPGPAKSGVVSGDRLIVDMARKLGISTQGKTRDDIENEIVARASQAPAQPGKPPEAARTEEATPPQQSTVAS